MGLLCLFCVHSDRQPQLFSLVPQSHAYRQFITVDKNVLQRWFGNDAITDISCVFHFKDAWGYRSGQAAPKTVPTNGHSLCVPVPVLVPESAVTAGAYRATLSRAGTPKLEAVSAAKSETPFGGAYGSTESFRAKTPGIP